MDPNIVQFLEEDEASQDETMHSGADVEAFTAELKRVIEGNTSTLQQPSDSDSAVLSQGSSQSQFLPQWQSFGHDRIANLQSGLDLVAMEEKEQHSFELELQKHDSKSQNRKEDDDGSCEPNPLLDNPLTNACPPPQHVQNTFPLSQPMGMQTSIEQPINIQGLDCQPNPEKESQMDKLQNISHHPSMAMGSNDQQLLLMGFKDQQSLSTAKGNQLTSMGISREEVLPPVNQHTTGMVMSGQQAMTSGMSNQQSMTSSNQQPDATLKLNKQVPFGMLLPFIQDQLDKDRAMQLHTLYFKLKKNEISKDGFVQNMRSFVRGHMIKIAVDKLQTQAVRNSQTVSIQFQSQPQAPAMQMQVPSTGANPSLTQPIHDLASDATSSSNKTPVSVSAFLAAQLPTDLSNSTSDNNAAKSREVENRADSRGVQVSQMSASSSGALAHERKHPAIPVQGLNKQQHMQFSQISFPTYGSVGSSCSPLSATNAASSSSIQPQPHDSHMRQAPSHPNMAVNHLRPTSRAMNMTNMTKLDTPHSLNDPKKIMIGNLTQMNSNTALQQNQVQRPSSTSKEQKTGVSSSMTHVKQVSSGKSNEHQKAQLSSSLALSSLSPAPIKLDSTAPGNLKDESFEVQSSRIGFTTPTLTSSVSSPVPSPMDTDILLNSRIPSLTSPIGPGNNSKAPPKKPLVGQKKQMETPGSSPPSSKKQKVSGAFLDQSIEYLNDVTAVSGVNLMEEEEQLFSGSKEHNRVSEASRRLVQEEEERLILQKIPLQKKVVELMVKCGLKKMSNDVERCLSLCMEERMRGLISGILRLSKQRVDIEKPRYNTIITSNVRQQIMTINRKAREEWEKKQAEKSQKLNEPESSTGVDSDKDGSRARSTKEEDDKMRTTAANAAVRAATGVGDMRSRWQLMIGAMQKQGGSDTPSGCQTSKDVGRKPLATSRNTRENQEPEKRDPSAAFTTPASVRKVGTNQVVVAQVAWSISIKDVIAVLEREPQMSKSTLLYRLYEKVSADAVSE